MHTATTFRRFRWFLSPSGLTFLAITSFIIVGGYWRLTGLGSGSVWNDEAQSTIYALSILHTGTPGIVSQHLINNWEPLYPYLEAASIAALGQTDFAFRLPSAILGIALIPTAYWIGMRLRDRYVGLTFAAMVAFSTEYIGWSRQARWYMLFVVLMALGTLASIAWSRAGSKRARFLGLAGVTAACVALAFTSVGLFLLYAPGIVAGLFVYIASSRWGRIRQFFSGPGATASPSPGTSSPLVPYRFWPSLALAIAGAAVAIVVLEAPLVWGGLAALLRGIFGFSPYPPVWSSLYGTYLVNYYSAVIVLSFASIYFIAAKRDPFEIGLLAF